MAFEFLNLANNLVAIFSGLHRIEQYDYPEEALREAMLNALIHRDYAFSGSIIVNIYDDRIEFVSLGGIMPGLHVEDSFMGVSEPRNEKIANVFYRLKYIESYGTGLRRILQYYEDVNAKPEIKATNGAFMLTLPNMNYTHPLLGKHQQKPQHESVLNYLQENPFITNEIIQDILSVKKTRAYAIIKGMIHEGFIIKQKGEKKNIRYILNI
ncbi:MAG: hypothetical protein LBV40_02520 [Methanomicrobiales archaeon]|nr:hypothetical protein [Methanomicrobiales archaeon]